MGRGSHEHDGAGKEHGDTPVARADHDGHSAHTGHGDHAAMFRDRFWVSVLLTIPVLVWSPDVGGWLGFTAPTFPGSQWIPAIFGTAVFVYGGRVFIEGGISEIRGRQPGMMLLISMAIVTAFVVSWAAELFAFELSVWWEVATLIDIMLFGHWMEMRSIERARGAMSALAALLPDTAERVRDDDVETVAVDELALDDIVLVRPGARVPADGIVADGSAEIDESMITGESRPVAKSVGDTVVAGTVVAGSSLRVRVTAVGDATALSGIMRLVAEAQASASRTQALADRAAAALFYVAVAVALITFVVWLALGEPDEALIRTATVLIIACPHALGLAIPLVISISTTLGARNGLLVKNKLALERARELDVVIFDKTGTLTRGSPGLSDIVAALGEDPVRMLALAAAVERDSEHPVAAAIVAGAHARGIEAPTATDFEALAGRGARAMVDGSVVSVGGPRLLEQLDLAVPDELASSTSAWAAAGRSVLAVIEGDRVVGALAIEDEIRPESAEAVHDLHDLGVRVAMITGDSRAVADSVARRLGVDEVAAEVLPADKAAAVARFQDGGFRVAMVGDGVNDAPALAQADVGIAIGAGTDVAVESAGVVLVRSDPRDVVGAIRLSKATYRKMIENLVWATGYNAVAIPVAAGLLAPWGVQLPIAIGALAMSASTIIVALNAQLLRRVKLRPDDDEPPAPRSEPRPSEVGA